MRPDAFLSAPAHDVMTGTTFGSVPEAAVFWTAFEALTFLRVLGLTEATGVGAVLRMWPDLPEVAARGDGRVILLTVDHDRAVRLYIGTPDDLVAVEEQAQGLGFSLLTLIPRLMHAEIAADPRYRYARN